jgi:hypothetical protein
MRLLQKGKRRDKSGVGFSEMPLLLDEMPLLLDQPHVKSPSR